MLCSWVRLPQYLSPPRCINRYWWIVGATLPDKILDGNLNPSLHLIRGEWQSVPSVLVNVMEPQIHRCCLIWAGLWDLCTTCSQISENYGVCRCVSNDVQHVNYYQSWILYVKFLPQKPNIFSQVHCFLGIHCKYSGIYLLKNRKHFTCFYRAKKLKWNFLI